MKIPLLPLAAGIAVLAFQTSCKPKAAAPPSAAALATASADTVSAADQAAPAAAAETPAAAPQADAGANRPQGGNRPGGRNRQDGGNRQFAGGGGGAGQGGNFQQRADERMQQMKTDLGLTDDQAQKVRAVYEQQFGALRQQMGNQTGSREDRRAAFDKARTAANAEIEKILTPEQMPKWQAYQAQMQQRRAQGQQGGGGGRRNGGGGN